jgi:hypothetical protein
VRTVWKVRKVRKVRKVWKVWKVWEGDRLMAYGSPGGRGI